MGLSSAATTKKVGVVNGSHIRHNLQHHRGRMSATRNYFKVENDANSIAISTICNATISQGGKTKSYFQHNSTQSSLKEDGGQGNTEAANFTRYFSIARNMSAGH